MALSPMMQQYLKIKEEHKDHILFFRVGDFYEMFFDDAKLAAKELDLVLTGKDCGLDERAPMCGVPFHSCDAYISRLVKKGYKIAICEQMEDPATAKGLVRREVIRVITPGTVIESNMLDEDCNNFIGCIYIAENERTGLCFADVSTGEIHATLLLDGEQISIINEIGKFSPTEILFNQKIREKKDITHFLKEKIRCVAEVLEDSEFELSQTRELVQSHFGVDNLERLGMVGCEETVRAVGALISYLGKTQQNLITRLTSLDFYREDSFMVLDSYARKNLELTQTIRDSEKKGSLLWVLDRTKTAMGKRLIRSYIEQPLLNPAAILKRHAAVSELYSDPILCDDLTVQMGGIYDLERLMTRIVYGTASPREMRSLSDAAGSIPKLKELLKNAKCGLLREIHTQLDTLEDVKEVIENAIIDDPPISTKDGGMIRPGFNAEIDELHSILKNSKQILSDIEAKYREETGIKTLKVGYNKVFGYYIEVTKLNTALVPESFIRKQTLTNAERYITQELKDIEDKILGASERVVALELEMFRQVQDFTASQLHRIQNTASAVAKLDVMCSFANVSRARGYCCPDVTMNGEIIIEEGRHPVVEALLKDTAFVPNDTRMDEKDNRMLVITGPNMAGKSTYMRQVALICLMSQIGCYVPAKSAKLSVVDRIFTRIGASDDLSSGQSTFMVEMNEVAHILKNATKQSLLILDEIGRGTSTYDGMSIARAVIEYITDRRKLGAKTLFATHYHELTELESLLDGVVNYNIAVKKRGDDITFLRKIIRGGADESYGIEVAKLAGIPESVVSRAKKILAQLDQGGPVAKTKSAPEPTEDLGQISFTSSARDELAAAIEQIDLNTLTPIEALNKLYELKAML